MSRGEGSGGNRRPASMSHSSLSPTPSNIFMNTFIPTSRTRQVGLEKETQQLPTSCHVAAHCHRHLSPRASRIKGANAPDDGVPSPGHAEQVHGD